MKIMNFNSFLRPTRKSMRPICIMAGGAALIGFLIITSMNAQTDKLEPKADPPAHLETATLGGGCFWCVEAAYQLMDGVHSAVSGYSGGHVENPTYQQVCDKNTGHAEVVQIQYDPVKITFSEILDYFWQAHDPTTLNRQGNDAGPQYRSIILYHDDAQKKVAEASIKEAQAHFTNPIVTEVVPFKKFYEAEDYHQDYYKNNPRAGYCYFVIRPKIEKLSKELEKKK
jgi:peptide-methionine (S)-S-oxide reductase